MIVSKYEAFNGKSYVEAESYDKVLYELKKTNEETACFKKGYKEQEKSMQEMQARIDCLKAELSDIQMKNPSYDEPIKIADKLIHSTVKGKDLLGKYVEYVMYSKSELKQIAEHLLVYCNNCGNRD